MADFNLGEGLRKVMLAGVGALANTYEKGSEIVDGLVKKGELTVEQGKALNTELKRKVAKTIDDAKQTAKQTAEQDTEQTAEQYTEQTAEQTADSDSKKS
ncbi:phasin family protein [Bifidobacterium panos]|uniref:Cytosolic protein n=1 Tax=Bifidobacterium panos TaxID=2675321 RepID=A0ABX1SXV9_9BIFI|nr:phasin family protein [Bifidobacterium sp. DSM 109963]NMN02109.1 hypothetical protein [Bifidobacterium sp. DSM 109963]